jgi:hypothetical protein
MPFIGLGIHFAIALFFAVHAVRTGRDMYWLLILFSFPLLGSIVYFFAIYAPHSRLERGLRQAGRKLEQAIDPGRALREAQNAFDLTPTAHNQMVLARALHDAGQYGQAIEQFDACLRGPFGKDPEIALGAAMARLAHGQVDDALMQLQGLRSRAPDFRPEQVGLLMARAYVATDRPTEAAAEFDAVIDRFDSVEARAEYVLWALKAGQFDAARRELAVLDHRRKHMNAHTRSLYQELFRAVDAARGQLQR